MAALTVGELVSYLTLDRDQWAKGVKESEKDLHKLGRDIEKFADQSVRRFLQVSNSLAAIPAAAGAVSGSVQILSSLSGAVGLIPAAALGAVIAINTLKLGVQGFGEAVTAADPAAFAEALKTLSPAARASAIAVRDLADEWEGMQNSIQEKLFAGLSDDITRLGSTYIPVLERGMGGVATQFNKAAAETSTFLQQGRQVASVTTIFGNTEQSVGKLGQALTPLVSILLDVAAVGSEFLPALADGFAESAIAAAAFVKRARETGQLKAWISEGLSTIGDLVQLFKQLGQIAGLVFGGLDAGGANLLDTLLEVTAKVRDFLASFEAQQALRALGEALSTVSAVVTDVMITAFEELAPILVELAPAYAELAKQVGSVLVTALRILGPLLEWVAGLLASQIDWLGPLAIALYAAAKAWGVVGVAINLVTMLASVNPWILIIGATIALAILIVTHWDQIKAFLAGVWEWIKSAAAVAWEAIKIVIVNPVIDAKNWISDILGEIVGFFRDLGGTISGVVGGIVDAITWPFREAYRIIRGIIDNIIGAVNSAVSALDKLRTTNVPGAPVIAPGAGTGRIGSIAGAPSGRIGSGHFFRADGGRVRAGVPYWVGERGRRELMVPDQNGTIIPEDKIKGGDGYSFTIEHFHAAGQSPRDISEELLWYAKAKG